MAMTDQAAFRRQLIDSERQMDVLFRQLAVDIGNLVFRAQNHDGTVPIEALPRLQMEAAREVQARFLGTGDKAFDDNNEPLAAFPRIIADGQKAMIKIALERMATILDKALPEDVRRGLAAREIKR